MNSHKYAELLSAIFSGHLQAVSRPIPLSLSRGICHNRLSGPAQSHNCQTLRWPCRSHL